MTFQLKSCPFCAKPLTIRNGVNPYGRCDTEGCWMAEAKIGISCDDPKQVERWNTRPAPAATDTGLVTVGIQYAHEHSITGRTMWGWQKEWKGCSAIGTRELVTRSQAEKLLAAERANTETALEQRNMTIAELTRLEADNAAQAARIKELDGECNELVAKRNEIIGQRDHALNTCAQMEEDKDALEAKLAAAEKALERIAARDGIPLAGSFAAEIARAVLGGKPT